MRHPIDPKVDCVFKALLGSEDNRALLIHFLNAVLVDDLPAPITEVEILNPYNEREPFPTSRTSQSAAETEGCLAFNLDARLSFRTADEVEALDAARRGFVTRAVVARGAERHGACVTPRSGCHEFTATSGPHGAWR
jgi:hypothetical protein